MDKLSEITNTRLRILQHKGFRAAIRLENVFWSQLGEFAAEDKTTLSKLVFGVIEKAKETKNKTSLLRCYCIDRWRRRASAARLENVNFDMLAIIAACPIPIVIITPERKIAAFNPSFSSQIIKSRSRADGEARHRGIKLTFSEPLIRIQQRLIEDPTRISTYQVGFYSGNTTTYHRARFAIADRSQGQKSMLILFIDPFQPKDRPIRPGAEVGPAASALP